MTGVIQRNADIAMTKRKQRKKFLLCNEILSKLTSAYVIMCFGS